MCAKMTLNCGAAFVKYFLCILNFLLFVVGGALMVVSTWVAIDTPSFFFVTKISDSDSLQAHNELSILETGAYILIAAGGIILLLGFIGCCGAAMESKGLLATYGALIILVFLLEITAGILIAVFKQEVDDHFEEYLRGTLRNHYTTEENANSMTVTWDVFMKSMQCCGVHNYTDFEEARNWQENKTAGQLMPKACCKRTGEGLEVQDGVTMEASGSNFDILDDTCVYLPNSTNSNHLIGCLHRLQAATFYFYPLSISVAIGLGALEMVLVTLAFYLCRALSRMTKVAMVN